MRARLEISLRSAVIGALVLTLVAVGRIVSTYKTTSQGFDEPCHVAAGIELLDKHTYLLDPVHPPVSRIAIGLPLYLAGERFPDWQKDDIRLKNYNEVGNSILYGDNRLLRNLSLARLGILPFFIGCSVLVFLWARREFGNLAALFAVALFTTTPTVLAFSGLAYSDMPTACMQTGALLGFTVWLQKPSPKMTGLLGIALGLALASKLTSILFLFAGCGVITFVWRIFRVHEFARTNTVDHVRSGRIRPFSFAVFIAIIVLWGTYGFDTGRVRESMELSQSALPSFQHFPGPLASIARQAVLKDPLIPAPALVHGVAEGWVLNKNEPDAYLLGKTKRGGWWYFFPVAILVKAPVPLLLLCALGAWIALARARDGNWYALAPVACVVAVLVITMGVKYNAGVRHVLVLFPFMAIAGGCGAAQLLLNPGRSIWKPVIVAGLLVWQAISTMEAQHDYIAYFNEFAGSEPRKILLNGCDLDCGQDVFRLRDRLRDKHISHFTIALWSSSDITRVGLPDFDVLQPSVPVTGWIAISDRALLERELFHTTYDKGAFDWLSKYSPIERIGRTISLYYISPDHAPPLSRALAANLAMR